MDAPSATSPNPGPSGADAGGPGTDPAPPGPTLSEERLHRCREGRMVAGVAAGAADYFGIDPTLVRIGFVVLALMGGLSVPLYLAGWLLIPEEGGEDSIAETMLGHDQHR